MPLYEYRCSRCGPFDAHAEASAADHGAECPSCGAPGARTFTAPGGRVPRRQRQLEGLSTGALARVDRAQAGVASSGRLPAGLRLDGSGRPRAPRTEPGERRPWQLGH